jgi:hypothetical protein
MDSDIPLPSEHLGLGLGFGALKILMCFCGVEAKSLIMVFFVGRKRITGGVEEGKGFVEVVSVVCV